MNAEFITFMRNRRSQTTLVAPAPSEDDWKAILSAACRAADHGNLQPWRYCIYEGEGRNALGEIYWQHALDEVPTLSLDKKPAFTKKAFRAPAILLVYAHITKHVKVPAVEQIMAVSAATQQILLGLNALGYGAIWRSGPACYTSKTKALLSLQESDQIVGLIYAGTNEQSLDCDQSAKEVNLEPLLQWVRD